ASALREMVDSGQSIRGLVAPKVSYSRKQLDELSAFVKQIGGVGVAHIKLGEEGVTAAPLVKNAGQATLDAVIRKSGAQKGDMVFLMGGQRDAVLELMGSLRLELAR